MGAESDVIEDGGYAGYRGSAARTCLEARRDGAGGSARRGVCHPCRTSIPTADLHRQLVERPASTLDILSERNEAAAAVRGLNDRVVLTPGTAWCEMDAKLVGALSTILE